MGKLRVQGVLRPRCVVHHRMAGARCWIPGAGRSGNRVAACGDGAPGAGARAKRGRGGLVAVLGLVLSLFVGTLEAQVVSTRIWPARDYTRVTIESKNELKYTLFALRDPERLVPDAEGAAVSPALAELHGKVTTGDPYIEKLRVGRYRPGVLRLVLDLKASVN